MLQWRSDVAFLIPQIAVAQTHALLSDEPVYLMRWSVSDELNNVKATLGCLDIKGKHSIINFYQ